jgi:F-type H+-transporting ATPase subunit delta
MAELSTLARPYAEAIFRLARERNELAAWSDRLDAAAGVVGDARMLALIADPNVPLSKAVEILLSIAGGALGEAGGSMIRVLAENDRLTLLPEIRAQFELLRAEAEGVLEATVTTAMALTDAQKKGLIAALRSKFGRDVHVEVAIDPELIGGAVVSLGDRVIDGSVRGRLHKMASALG